MANLELGTVDNGKSRSEILKDALRCKGYSQREICRKDGMDITEFFSKIKEELFHS